MKLNRTLLVFAAAAAAICFVPTTQAQPNERPPRGERPARGEPGERADKMREHLAQQLNLTAEQKVKFDAIHAKAKEQRQAIMAGADTDREKVREQMRALHESTIKEVDAILTPEQKVKADEFRAKMKQRGEKMKERGGEKHKERKARRQTEN